MMLDEKLYQKRLRKKERRQASKALTLEVIQHFEEEVAEELRIQAETKAIADELLDRTQEPAVVEWDMDMDENPYDYSEENYMYESWDR